jgi:hypothetical protein
MVQSEIDWAAYREKARSIIGLRRTIEATRMWRLEAFAAA